MLPPAGLTGRSYSVLASLYGLGQILSPPLVARLGERLGRKMTLLVSFPVSAASYLVMATSTSPLPLFASRILVGLVKQTIAVSRALVADCTDPGRERTTVLGKLSAVSHTAFVIGPAVGGILSKYNRTFPAVFAAVLFAADFVLVSVLLVDPNAPSDEQPQQAEAPLQQASGTKVVAPTGHPAVSEDADASACPAMNAQSTGQAGKNSPSLWQSFKALRHPTTGRLLFVLAATNFVTVLLHSSFSFQVACRFGVDSTGLGLLMSGLSVFGALSSAFMVPMLLRRTDEAWCATAGAAGLVVAFLGQVAAIGFPAYVSAMAVEVVARSVLSACVLSLYSKQFAHGQHSVSMAVVGSLDGVARVSAPLLGSLLVYDRLPESDTCAEGVDGPALFAGMVFMGLTAALGVMARRRVAAVGTVKEKSM